MAEEVDPFTGIIAEIWAALEAHAPFTALVKPGNRIKGAAKLNLSPSETPQVQIVPTGGGEIALFKTSSSSHFGQNFTIAIVTSRDTPEASFFPIKWEVIRAMAKGKKNNLNLPAVMKVNFTDASEALSEAERLAGWDGALTVSVHFGILSEALISS